MTNEVVPTGEVIVVAPDELFFSTTDRKGVIELANSVFARISGYSREELEGQPHNIIRHPDMPGGAFHIMWERILRGESFTTYVKNLAANGTEYWTLASVTPLGDGFLSVRAPVLQPDLLTLVKSEYALASEAEANARAGGNGRALAAKVGAETIASSLRQHGYASLDDFIRTLVPAEQAARSALSRPAAASFHASGAIGEVLLSAHHIDFELEAVGKRVSEYLDLSRRLADAHGRIAPTLDSLAATSAGAARAAESVGTDAPVLVTTARAAVDLADKVGASLVPLHASLADITTTMLDVNVTLSLAILHNDMAATFAHDTANGEPDHDAFKSIEILSRALAQSIHANDAMLTHACDVLLGIAGEIEVAADSLAEYQRVLAQWRLLVVRSGMSGALNAALVPIDAEVKESAKYMTELGKLGAECAQMARKPDAETLIGAIELMHKAAAGA